MLAWEYLELPLVAWPSGASSAAHDGHECRMNFFSQRRCLCKSQAFVRFEGNRKCSVEKSNLARGGTNMETEPREVDTLRDERAICVYCLAQYTGMKKVCPSR